jgi:hypothetical protein
MAQISFKFGDLDAQNSGYKIGSTDIETVRVNGASDAVAREANAGIRVLADRLQRGEIDAAEFYSQMQHEVKMLHLGQAALARGGIDAMRPEDLKRVENIIERQFGGVEGKFPGLRAFAEDIAGGRYGNAGELSEGVLNRAGMYADAGRGTYENERVALARENGHDEAHRIAGAADNCPTCARENGVWKPIDEVVPIGDSECGARCFCVIVTRKSSDESSNAQAQARQDLGGRDQKGRAERGGDVPYSAKELRGFRKWGEGVANGSVEKVVPSSVIDDLVAQTAPGSRERMFLVDKDTGKVVDYQIGTPDSVEYSTKGYASAQRLVSIHQHNNGTAPSGADWFLAATKEKFEEVVVVCEDEIHIVARPSGWLAPLQSEPDLERRFDELFEQKVDKWLAIHNGDEDATLRDTLQEVNELMEKEYGISYRRVSLDGWRLNAQ